MKKEHQMKIIKYHLSECTICKGRGHHHHNGLLIACPPCKGTGMRIWEKWHDFEHDHK